jgi:hypothetical protein
MRGFSPRFALGAAVVITLAATACSDATGPSGLSAQQALDLNRGVWQGLALNDYDMLQRRSCECTAASTRLMYIRVRDNEITAMWETGSFDPVGEDLWRLFLPVEDLFDAIRNAINDDSMCSGWSTTWSSATLER